MSHTVSSVREWRACQRRYLYKYVQLVRPARAGKALGIGTVFHAGLEVFLAGGSVEAVLAHAAELMAADAWWQSDEGIVEGARTRAMLRAYYTRWDASRVDWWLVSVEETFSVQLGGVPITGKRDALLRDKRSGVLYLWEHKTASDDIATVGADYWQRMALDAQVTVYQEATRQERKETPAILYDVVRKPQGAPKLKEAIRKRSAETEEQYEARKTAARETLAEFEQRLVDAMLAEPDKYLVRHEVHRTTEQTRELLSEFAEAVQSIEQYRGSYPRNDVACQSRYGACAYLGVCGGIESLDSDKFTKLDTAHPELATAEDANHGNSDSDAPGQYDDCPI